MCKCFEGWKGNSCLEPSCEQLNFCTGNGNCTGYNFCECNIGWLGENCEIPDCSNLNNCSNNGLCTKTNTCKCNEGFLGDSCSETFNCTELENCSNNGICLQNDTDKKCLCFSGYYGLHCENIDCSQLNNCNGNGKCIQPNLCKCNFGYNSSDCSQFSCENLKYCSYNGFCDKNQKCICYTGWNGLYCNQSNCNLLNNCSDFGRCIGPNECDCYIGFDGQSCEQPIGENLNDPIFLFSNYHVDIGEFVNLGEKLIKVFATDIDKGRNGFVRYLILETLDYNYFDIDNNAGSIYLVKPIFNTEKDQLVIQLKAYDDGRPQRFSSTVNCIFSIKRLYTCNDIINKTVNSFELLQNHLTLKSINFKPSDLPHERIVSYYLSNEKDFNFINNHLNLDKYTGSLIVSSEIPFGRYMFKIYAQQIIDNIDCELQSVFILRILPSNNNIIDESSTTVIFNSEQSTTSTSTKLVSTSRFVEFTTLLVSSTTKTNERTLQINSSSTLKGK